MTDHERWKERLTTASLGALDADIKNAAYDAVIVFYEGLEHRGRVRGNGHHMAQKIAAAASELLRERWSEEK
tara:strand:+ start:1440 stop:1655 length:216 start_codon:yes stop_codon:yes gene_type:complete